MTVQAKSAHGPWVLAPALAVTHLQIRVPEPADEAMDKVVKAHDTAVAVTAHVGTRGQAAQQADLKLVEALLCAARRAAASGDQRLVRICQAAYYLSLAGDIEQAGDKAYWECCFEACLRQVLLALDARNLKLMAFQCRTEAAAAIAGGAASTVDLESATDWLERLVDVFDMPAVPWVQETTEDGSDSARTLTVLADARPSVGAGAQRRHIEELPVPGPSASLRPATMSIYLLSPFRVLVDDAQVSGWPNSRGKSILKYLVVHRQRPIARDLLMDTFWPQTPAAAARNNLKVAMCGLRKALAVNGSKFPFVIFSEGCYGLNPDLRVWVDAEQFNEHLDDAASLRARGKRSAAIESLRAAEAIYQSELLVEDRYDQWLVGTRKRFEDRYLSVVDELIEYEFESGNYALCLALAAKALSIEPCHELAHRALMSCYGRMGKRELAIRQFHACAEALSRELRLAPSAETLALFHRIRQMQVN